MSQGNKRALFIVPPTGRYIREDRCQTPIDRLKTVALRPPIDLMYVAAAYESKGWECRLVDYPGEDRGWDALESDLRTFKPSVMLMSITTPSLDEDVKATELAKKVDPTITTIAKGAHFNTLDTDAMERWTSMDIVLRGEYEMTCLELAEGKPVAEVTGLTWRDGTRIVRNEARKLPDNLDDIPYPARHLTNNALYIRPDTGEKQTTLVTNRGCPFSCTYCLANQASGLKNRYRSVENVMGEIRECVHKHGIRSFLFRSDLFTQNKAWVIKLCEAILAEKLDISWASNSRVDTLNEEVLKWMKRAGCWLIAFGVEKGDNTSLEKINKKANIETARKAMAMTREAGIRRSMYLLYGLPDDNEDVLRSDLEFAKSLDPEFLEIFYPYPFPGTPLHKEAIELGLLGAGVVPKEAYGLPCMPTKHITLERLAMLRTQALREFYMRPKFIIRTLRSANSPTELFNYVRAGASQAKQFVFGD